jgi:hypothetical protein
LAKKKVNKVVNKPTKYNRILKQFTAINNSLPEERKISIKQRRQILKQYVLPQFDKVPDYKLRVKGIKAAILKEYDKLPAKPLEACNLNFIDPSNYKEPIEFFDIDNFFERTMPDCIYVKVSAGEFGETKIFNTRDYNYGRKGVRDITDKIRTKVKGQSGAAYYVGYQKLRPNKTNNGQSDSYYLDMILFINEKAQGETKTQKFKLPNTAKVQRVKNKVQNLLDEKFKLLLKEKDSQRNAKKQIQKTIKQIKDAKTKLKRNPNSKTAERQETKALIAFVDKIEKYYQQGKITKEKYEAYIKKNL